MQLRAASTDSEVLGTPNLHHDLEAIFGAPRLYVFERVEAALADFGVALRNPKTCHRPSGQGVLPANEAGHARNTPYRQPCRLCARHHTHHADAMPFCCILEGKPSDSAQLRLLVTQWVHGCWCTACRYPRLLLFTMVSILTGARCKCRVRGANCTTWVNSTRWTMWFCSVLL